MPSPHTSEPLFISRSLLQIDHSKLRERMTTFNHELPDVTLRWRHLGKTGVMLVQSGEYQALTDLPQSGLLWQPAAQVAQELNKGFLKGRQKGRLPLQEAAFLGHNTATYVHVGFCIEPEHLMAERLEMTNKLDELNLTPGNWEHSFQPYLSIATLNRRCATEEVRDAFQSIMPPGVTLYGARAVAG